MNGQNSNSRTKSYVTFLIGQQCYAIDALEVREIKSEEVHTSPTESPQFVVGLTYYNQKIIPMIDPNKIFQEEIISKIKLILFVEKGNHTLGLIIRDIPNIIKFKPKDIVEFSTDKTDDLSRQLICGSIKKDKQSYFILNIKRLLDNAYPPREIEDDVRDVKHER